MSHLSSIQSVLLVVAAALAIHAPCRGAGAQVVAEALDPARDAEAHARFEAGRIAYAAARYEDALADFEDAYALSERPELLYNIAQCHDRLRHDAEAIVALERYLAAVPEATNRVEVETRVAALRDAEARRRAALLAATSLPNADRRASSGGIETEWWFWTLIGVAVVGAGVGIGAGVAASTPSSAPPIPGDVGPGGVVMALGSW